MKAWGVMWRSDNRLDGRTRELHWPTYPFVLFRTRRECRAYIEEHYGYIRNRPDLQREPHGWKMPKPVRVTVKMKATK